MMADPSPLPPSIAKYIIVSILFRSALKFHRGFTEIHFGKIG